MTQRIAQSGMIKSYKSQDIFLWACIIHRRVGGRMIERRLKHLLLSLLIATTLGATGCGSYAIARMPTEDSIPVLAASKLSSARYDDRISYVTTSLGLSADDEYNVALYETGNESAANTLVMIHGVFADHTTWRFVQGYLVDEYRLWSMDLPGCGQSDAPPFEDSQGNYTPLSLAERVLMVLEQKIETMETPPSLTLVGHSLSGQVVLSALSDPQLRVRYANVIEHINSVVLLSPLDISGYEPSSVFTDIVRLSGNMVSLTWNLGFLEYKVAKATRKSFPNPDHAPREEALKRLEVLRNPIHRQSMQAMLRQALPLDDGQFDEMMVARIKSQYKHIEVPTLILWGARDDILPVQMGHKLAAEVPASELIVFDNSKHSIHQDSPKLCASIIEAFVTTQVAPLTDTSSVHLAVAHPTNSPRRRINTSDIGSALSGQ
jgi:pimeloyl-ACP methyl ester carboxylesterase